MLSLSAPWWLLGLAAVPLIRWLHRFRLRDRVVPVSALFPWRGTVEPEGAGSRRASPDPLWMLRAAIVVGLLLALAGPRWTVRQQPLEIWVEDSLSLYAREPDGSRLASGVDALLVALAQRGDGPVTVRSLGNPARVLDLEPIPADDRRARLLAWLATPGGEPRPPPAVQMTRAADHWLLGAGADPVLADWLRAAPVGRVIQVGTATENVALTALAARPSLRQPDAWLVLAAVTNLGTAAAARELELRAAGQAPLRASLTVPPGGTARRTVTVTGDGLRVEARLFPADALALDDALTLDLPAKPVARLEGACGPALRAALASHPGLRLEEGGTTRAALTVSCAESAASLSGPRLVVHPAVDPQPVQGPLSWRPAAGRLRQLPLPADGLRQGSSARGPAAREPLLTAGDTPLIVANARDRVVEVLLDMEAPELARQPHYPVLLSDLLDWVLDRPLLEVQPGVRRDPVASRIAPQALPSPARPPTPIGVTGQRNLAPWVLAGCGLLLLFDIGWVARAGWRELR